MYIETEQRLMGKGISAGDDKSDIDGADIDNTVSKLHTFFLIIDGGTILARLLFTCKFCSGRA